MENEIMNNEMEVETTDVIDSNDVMFVTEESDAGKAIGVVIALGAAAALATIAIARKCKGKMTEWQIKRLEKKGYIVTKAETVESTEEEGCEEDSTEETEE